jgi:hypothetical protein
VAACPNVEKCTDSRAQGGDNACTGGGRVHCHVEGGGGKKRLTFPGVEAMGDVELGALFFFGLVTKMARRLLLTPFLYVPHNGRYKPSSSLLWLRKSLDKVGWIVSDDDLSNVRTNLSNVHKFCFQ